MTRRSGFTLLELMVALFLTGIVGFVVHQVMGALVEAQARYVEARDRLDVEVNAAGWLRSTFASVDLTTARATEFEGGPLAVSFGALVPTRDGWAERKRVHLVRKEDRLLLILGIDSLPLIPGVAAVRLDYLVSDGVGTVFVPEWRTPMSAPAAVRLRITFADSGQAEETRLFAVGVRG